MYKKGKEELLANSQTQQPDSSRECMFLLKKWAHLFSMKKEARSISTSTVRRHSASVSTTITQVKITKPVMGKHLVKQNLHLKLIDNI